MFWMFGLQPLVLVGEVPQSLGGGVYLEEGFCTAGPWGCVIPAHFLPWRLLLGPPWYEQPLPHCPCIPPWLEPLVCLPHHDPLKRFFLLWVVSIRCSGHNNSKVTDTGSNLFSWSSEVTASCHAHMKLLHDAWSTLSFLSVYFIVCVQCFAYMSACVPGAHLFLWRSEEVSDALELELRTVVSYCMNAGNRTQALCKNKFS